MDERAVAGQAMVPQRPGETITQRRPGESVASKIMRLLDAFGAEHTELGPSEIARRSGLP